MTEQTKRCGHVAHTPNGPVGHYTCDLAKGHKGLHRERTKLREGWSVTNWGSDGLAPHATRDKG